MPEDHLKHIEFHSIRPRIRVETTYNPVRFCKVLSRNLENTELRIDGQVYHNYATIFPLEEDQHYWSPQLTVTIEPAENRQFDQGTLWASTNRMDPVCILLFHHWVCSFYHFNDRALLLVTRQGCFHTLVRTCASAALLIAIPGRLAGAKVRT